MHQSGKGLWCQISRFVEEDLVRNQQIAASPVPHLGNDRDLSINVLQHLYDDDVIGTRPVLKSDRAPGHQSGLHPEPLLVETRHHQAVCCQPIVRNIF